MNATVGVNVWWTCPEVNISAVEVEKALKKSGFETADMKAPSRRKEISRAVYSLQNRQGKENRRITEKATSDESQITYGILDREQTGDTVSFEQQTKVTLVKADGSVKTEGRLVKEVEEAIAYYTGKITDEDVRMFLRNLIRRCCGISKRPTGGIYFVPEKYAPIIRSAQAVLTDMNSGARLYIEGVHDGVEERQNVWQSVEDEISARLEETLTTVDNIERRATAVKEQEAKVEGLRNLMDVYRGLLGEEAKYEKIAAKIEDAIRVVGVKMSELETGAVERAEKKAEKEAAMKAEREKEGAAMPPVKRCETKSNPWVLAALKVLRESDRALTYQEIAKAAVEGGLETKSVKPEITMSGRLSDSIANGDGYFRRVGRGMYALAE